MYDLMKKITEKPPLYTPSKLPFWDDEYISKQMLKAHLDPEFEGASRKLSFIKTSAEWIKKVVPPENYPLLLDIGCGPGIYAEAFSRLGYQVTGIDFSKRSIRYAKNSAEKLGLNINYCCHNYLELDLNCMYDFATMIYCDYGALSTENRRILMDNVYRNLKVGGKFLLDVFSIKKYEDLQEMKTWKLCPHGGFWREGEYFELAGSYKYPNYVTLEQTTIFSNNEIESYYLWNTCFDKDRLIKEATETGFKVCDIFGDVAGTVYNKESLTLAVLLEK